MSCTSSSYVFDAIRRDVNSKKKLFSKVKSLSKRTSTLNMTCRFFKKKHSVLLQKQPMPFKVKKAKQKVLLKIYASLKTKK